DGIQLGRGNEVAGKRRARPRRADDRTLCRVDDDARSLSRLWVDGPEVRQELREVAAPHRRRRHAVESLELFPVPVPLEIRHVEEMVLPHGTAGGVAVLIP